MDGTAWLEIVVSQFEAAKRLSERAAEQVSDADFFRVSSDGGNSVAVLMRHMGGNLRSRWLDFLTTDGEKPDRQREGEFEAENESRADIVAQWEHGWGVCLDSLRALTADDLGRTIKIRYEPLGVIPAIHRSLSHADYHCGQIVQLARHWCGDSWKSLSIPRGESDEYLARMKDRFGS